MWLTTWVKFKKKKKIRDTHFLTLKETLQQTWKRQNKQKVSTKKKKKENCVVVQICIIQALVGAGAIQWCQGSKVGILLYNKAILKTRAEQVMLQLCCSYHLQ